MKARRTRNDRGRGLAVRLSMPVVVLHARLNLCDGLVDKVHRFRPVAALVTRA